MENFRKQKNNGFTLVELIVVIVILAILAAIAIPALTGYIKKSEDTAAISDARNLSLALSTAATEVYAFGEILPAGQEGITNWDGGTIRAYHNKDGSGAPFTVGFTMIAGPTGTGVLTEPTFEKVAELSGKDIASLRTSIYGIIVEFNNLGAGKSDIIAAFVYKYADDKWVGYNSKDGTYQVFPTAAEALNYARKVSPHF